MQRWVIADFKYRIKACDTMLPQDDPNKTQRELELNYKKTVYQYLAKDKELPGMIAKLPDDEQFSCEYFIVGSLVTETACKCLHSFNLWCIIRLFA